MAKKGFFAGRHQEKPQWWNLAYERGSEVILTSVVSYGLLDLDEVRTQLLLEPCALILVEVEPNRL